jgi:hypothetical protein
LKSITQVIAPCRHPRKARVHDVESGMDVCTVCATEFPVSISPRIPNAEKFGRAPVNAAVFRENMGSTSRFPGKKGPEPVHKLVIKSVYGSRLGDGNLATTRINETCPNCHKETPVAIFGQPVLCMTKGCGTQLGHMVFRSRPIPHTDAEDGGQSILFWGDLRTIQSWDGPENSDLLKYGRELFSKHVLGKVSDEKAHKLAQKFLKGLKEMERMNKRNAQLLLASYLESNGVH